MSTLHTLRRHYDLSLGDLAQLTGIPLRRLAEYEYEDRPLPPEDQHALISLFSREMQSMGSGWSVAAPAVEHTARQPDQAFLLAAFAATVALSGTLGLSRALRDFATRMVDTVPAMVARIEPTLPAPTPVPTTMPAAIVLPVPPVPSPTVAVQPTATAQPTPPPEPPYPHRCPVVSTHGTVVIMAGYTAGTHEPTGTNGAVDLAIDANGDGLAEPWASRNAEVRATHDGVATVSLDSWPAGNYVSLQGAEGWRTVYSHLESVDVHTGDKVQTGQRIGTIGATGQAGGPHLDYKVWHNDENMDPTSMLRCD
jgi:hypothetical protein